MMLFRPAALTALALLSASCGSREAGADAYAYERRYEEGESFGYALANRRALTVGETVTQSGSEAVSAHEVFFDGGVPRERAAWRTFRELPDGEPRDVSGVPASIVSLAPGGTFEMNKPADDAAMLGMVTDLVTFYAAVGPKSGVARLRRPGDAAAGEPVTGDWSDGAQFPYGKDALAVEIAMTGLDARFADYETRFRPPDGAALDAPRPFMSEPVCDGPNNWMMIRRQGPGFLAAWGCESFTVRTRIERASGRIVSASMSNDVVRDMRLCTDEALEACQPLPQMKEHRDLTLSPAP